MEPLIVGISPDGKREGEPFQVSIMTRANLNLLTWAKDGKIGITPEIYFVFGLASNQQAGDKKTVLNWTLNPIVRSAAELFVSGDWEKVKRCGDRECGRIYLDNSRNQSRR
jgi:hypothetical protein